MYNISPVEAATKSSTPTATPLITPIREIFVVIVSRRFYVHSDAKQQFQSLNQYRLSAFNE